MKVLQAKVSIPSVTCRAIDAQGQGSRPTAPGRHSPVIFINKQQATGMARAKQPDHTQLQAEVGHDRDVSSL